MVVGSGDDDDDNGDDDNNNSKIIINIMTSCVVSFVFPFRRISKNLRKMVCFKYNHNVCVDFCMHGHPNSMRQSDLQKSKMHQSFPKKIYYIDTMLYVLERF